MSEKTIESTMLEELNSLWDYLDEIEEKITLAHSSIYQIREELKKWVTWALEGKVIK
jgi:hypothetical protein